MMAAELGQAPTETQLEEVRPPAKKPRSKAKQSSPEQAAQPTQSKVRRYTEEQKLATVKQIDEEIVSGKSTLKAAVKKAGISDETYYNWKRAATPATEQGDEPAHVPSSEGDDLSELLALEEENRSLRKRLAEKLRAENAALKKKLGLP